MEKKLIINTFSNLEKVQKISIINFLMTLVVCDDKKEIALIRHDFLNSYNSFLELNSHENLFYLESFGQIGMIEDLKSLNKEQKELIIMLSWEILILTGQPIEIEYITLVNVFEQIGVSQDYNVQILKNVGF